MKRLIYLFALLFNLLSCGAVGSTCEPKRYFQGDAIKLAEAIRREDVVSIPILAKGLDLNAAHRDGMTFLFYAMNCNKPKAIGPLILAGADPFQVTEDLGSPLDAAVRWRTPEFLEAMLNSGVSVNALNSWKTPLIFATVNLKSLDNLKLLVSRGADINITDSNLGRSPIYDALASASFDAVDYLLEKGARVDQTLVTGKSLATLLEFMISRATPNSAAGKKLLHLKEVMMARGVKFPVAPVVRENSRK